MDALERKKKIQRKKFTVKNIFKRAVFITAGSAIMAYGLEAV